MRSARNRKDLLKLDRREFLVTSGIALGTGLLELTSTGCNPEVDELRLCVFRSADLLKLEISSRDLQVIRPSIFHDLRIRPKRKQGRPVIAIKFPGQHILEQCVPEDSRGSNLPIRGTLGALESQPTTLVFRWPEDLDELLFSEQELLRIFEFECLFGQGKEEASHLEPVTGLTLRPSSEQPLRWRCGRREPAEGVNVLWTARLTGEHMPLRMWVSGNAAVNAPFPAPINDADRKNIAETFSGSDPVCAPGSSVPAPTVQTLALSSQRGWFDIKASWDPAAGCGLAEWTDSVSHGRDHFVEVVYKMWCYPEGIPLLLIKQSTREFETYSHAAGMGTGVGAYLKIRLILRALPDSRLVTADDLLESPFSELRLPPEDTYVIDIDQSRGDRPAASGDYVIGSVNDPNIDLGAIAFIPLVGGKPLKLKAKVRDHGGEEHEVLHQFILVGNALVSKRPDGNVRMRSQSDEQKLDSAWEHGNGRYVSMPSLPWSVAPEKQHGDTKLTVTELDIVRAAPRGAKRPFYARTHRLSALVDVSSALAKNPLTVPLTYRTEYKPDPAVVRTSPTTLLDPNAAPGGAFVRVYGDSGAGLVLANGAEQGMGALATPNVQIGGVGHESGLILGPPSIPSAPTITDLFPASANLLGAFALKEIVGAGSSAPAWIFRSGSGKASPFPTPDEDPPVDGWLATLVWSTEKLQSKGLFVAADGCRLGILAGIGAKMTTGQVTWNSEGRLANFAVAFPSYTSPLLKIVFDDLRFAASSSHSPRIDCQIARIEFDGLLKLMDSVREILHLPPSLKININSDAINVEYVIAHDDPIDVIGLTFSSIKIRTAVIVSLKGSPVRVLLGLNSKEAPFRISSVSGYAGGGYFAAEATSREVSVFQIAFEAGASVRKDFVIAKGEVSLMAGFYFSAANSSFEFEGYVRLHGCMNVLIIGGIDILAYLGLKWSSPSNFSGRCEVRVKITIGWFEVSQGFEASHSFGSGARLDQLSIASAGATLEAFCEEYP